MTNYPLLSAGVNESIRRLGRGEIVNNEAPITPLVNEEIRKAMIQMQAIFSTGMDAHLFNGKSTFTVKNPRRH
jgi:hypothetical protein